MKNLFQKIIAKRDNFQGKLKNRLDNLSPQAKVNTVLWLSAFYLLVTIFFIINAIKGNDNDLELQHIEAVKIIDSPIKKPVSKENDTTFNYQPYE